MGKNIIERFQDLALGYSSLFSENFETYVKPNIPEKKLNNAIRTYAKDVNKDQVVALCDLTLFGSGKVGFLLTPAGFYYKETLESPVYFSFHELEDTEVLYSDKKFKIYLNDGKIITISTDLLEHHMLKVFFDEVLELKEEGLLHETDKFVIVEDMPEEVKKNYLKVIIQMTYQDDNIIDEKEMAEIQTLMTQLDFSPELRYQIRKYIYNPDQSRDQILAQIEDGIPTGSEYALHISLIKDLTRVFRVTKNNASLYDSRYIMDIADKYDIDKKQLEVIEMACINDEKILRGEVNDEDIVKNSKELAAKAATVGIPVTAIYLSGSVVGLSAAGVTSGLAALGLGGVLGLSSMVTGIGVAVLIGVGTYKGIKWLAGGGKRDRVEKREYMIQEIIKINQKTINNLAEDVNYFATRIVNLTRESKINQKKIQKLAAQVEIFTQTLSTLKQKGVDLEEILYEEK